MIHFGLYRMLIIDEVKKLRQILLNRSSLKEQAFYQFLVGEPLNCPTENDLTEIEQICLSVFGGDLFSKKELIVAQRNTQPIGGMHYTKNLIELCAMGRENPELERENLKTYSENHSTRDFYILHVLFPDIESNRPIAQGAIDEIALHLYTKNFPKEWKALLFAGLQEISDLIDLYVIEQWYKQAMDDSPIVHQKNDIIYVRDTLIQVVKKIEHWVKFAMGVVSGLLLLSSCWLVPWIIKNWDKVEPIIAVTGLLFSLIGILITVSVGFIPEGFIPDRIKFLNLLREKFIDWVFQRKGFNRSELKETLARLANQSEK